MKLLYHDIEVERLALKSKAKKLKALINAFKTEVLKVYN